MNYENKFDLIRNLIDKTFPNYEKEYAINLINGTYQVIFVIPGGTFSLTVLEDSEWHKIKKKIKDKIKSFSFAEPDCQICFNKIIFQAIYCRHCTIVICRDCFTKILLKNRSYCCPQCRYILGLSEGVNDLEEWGIPPLTPLIARA